jgi:hypothetical protein
MFRRNELALFAERQHVPPKDWYSSTQQHGVTFRNAVTLIKRVVTVWYQNNINCLISHFHIFLNTRWFESPIPESPLRDGRKSRKPQTEYSDSNPHISRIRNKGANHLVLSNIYKELSWGIIIIFCVKRKLLNLCFNLHRTAFHSVWPAEQVWPANTLWAVHRSILFNVILGFRNWYFSFYVFSTRNFFTVIFIYKAISYVQTF